MVRLLETIQIQLIGWIMCVANRLYSFHVQMTLNECVGRSDFGKTGNGVCVCVCWVGGGGYKLSLLRYRKTQKFLTTDATVQICS